MQHRPTAAALSSSFLLNHAPIVLVGECIDYKTYGVMQQREYESWIKKIEEIKQLVEFRQSTNTAFEGKMQLLRFSVLPGSAEAQVIWCGIVKCLLIAYFIGNILRIFTEHFRGTGMEQALRPMCVSCRQ